MLIEKEVYVFKLMKLILVFPATNAVSEPYLSFSVLKRRLFDGAAYISKGYWEIDIAKKVGKFIASKYSKMELSSLSQVL